MADIAIGAPAIDRTGHYTLTSTRIVKENPANDSGSINSVEIWVYLTLIRGEVATFEEVTTNTFTTRDSEALGDVASGSKQTFSGLDMDVETGDYLGAHAADGHIEGHYTGSVGYWYAVGDYIPCANQAFTFSANRVLSLYGTGETAAAAYYHGLKVQGVGELALCDVGSHPLRIRKGGTTYGIELVATDDPNASKIRMKTGAGIKAIRKYT